MEMMCRACLSTENQMVHIDESFVTNYNLLTNLNITLLDRMPQYSCVTCLEMLKCFIEFREKSITSETTLREIIYSDVKNENETLEIGMEENPSENGDDLLDIKSEIKVENDFTIDNFDVTFDEYDEDEDLKDIMVTKDENDVKPRRTRNNKLKKYELKEHLDNINEDNLLFDVKPKRSKNNKLKKYELKEHLDNINEDKLLCGLCPKTFEEKNALSNHLENHRNEKQCSLCREPVNSFSQLLAHRLTHVPLKQSKCHICERRFKSCVYLEHHYRKLHIEGDDKKLSCSICQVTCNTPKRLSSHMLQVHSCIKYFCDVCGKGFRSKTNLKSHIKFHSNNKTYVCDMCEFSCKHNSGLKDHKIRKHNPKKVYCKQCKRPFVSQEQHDRHKCSRTIIVCPVCGLQLNGNARLSRHMLLHSNTPRYECTKCPNKYRSKPALLAHLDRHDGNRTKQCEYCPAKFYSASVLIKHRRTHTGEKPYVCKVCNKGFTGKNNLKVHMRVHGEYLIVKKNSEQECSNN